MKSLTVPAALMMKSENIIFEYLEKLVLRSVKDQHIPMHVDTEIPVDTKEPAPAEKII